MGIINNKTLSARLAVPDCIDATTVEVVIPELQPCRMYCLTGPAPA